MASARDIKLAIGHCVSLAEHLAEAISSVVVGRLIIREQTRSGIAHFFRLARTQYGIKQIGRDGIASCRTNLGPYAVGDAGSILCSAKWKPICGSVAAFQS